jgi:hypothetical protein
VAQCLWEELEKNKSITAGLPKAFQPTLEDLIIRRSQALALAPETL